MHRLRALQAEDAGEAGARTGITGQRTGIAHVDLVGGDHQHVLAAAAGRHHFLGVDKDRQRAVQRAGADRELADGAAGGHRQLAAGGLHIGAAGLAQHLAVEQAVDLVVGCVQAGTGDLAGGHVHVEAAVDQRPVQVGVEAGAFGAPLRRGLAGADGAVIGAQGDVAGAGHAHAGVQQQVATLGHQGDATAGGGHAVSAHGQPAAAGIQVDGAAGGAHAQVHDDQVAGLGADVDRACALLVDAAQFERVNLDDGNVAAAGVE